MTQNETKKRREYIHWVPYDTVYEKCGMEWNGIEENVVSALQR